MGRKMIEFENVQQFRDSEDTGLERTVILLSGINGEECSIRINHDYRDAEVFVDQKDHNVIPNNLYELRDYLVNRLGGSPNEYRVSALERYDKTSVADAVEGLTEQFSGRGKFRFIVMFAEYKI